MSDPTIPAAAVIMIDEIAYMTVRDWTNADGTPAAPGGIDHLDSYFGDGGNASRFAGIINAEKNIQLDEVLGNIVLQKEDEIKPVPKHPALCTFRVANGDQHMVARWFAPLGIAAGQQYAVHALTNETSDLLTRFRDVLAKYRANGTVAPGEMIQYREFLAADLTAVYSSVIMAKPVVKFHAGNADGVGLGGI